MQYSITRGGLPPEFVERDTGPNGRPRQWIVNPEQAAVAFLSRQTSGPRRKGESAGGAGAPTQPPDGDPLANINIARLQFEGYRALRERLDYEKAKGLVIDVAEVTDIYNRHVQAAKTKFMAVGSKARGRIPHLTIDDQMTIEELCREAIEELRAELIKEQAGAENPGGE